MTAHNRVNTALTRPGRVFPRPFRNGGFVPPHMGGQMQEDKALMGGLMRGDRPYGGT